MITIIAVLFKRDENSIPEKGIIIEADNGTSNDLLIDASGDIVKERIWVINRQYTKLTLPIQIDKL